MPNFPAIQSALEEIANGILKLATAVGQVDVASPGAEPARRPARRSSSKVPPTDETTTPGEEDASVFEPNGPEDDDPQAEAKEAEPVTLKSLQALAAAMIKAGKRDDFKKILSDEKAASLSLVPEERWAAVSASIEKALA